MADSNSSSCGIGLWGILTIIFVVAKLAGALNWSWWWVFAPLWIPWLVVIGALLVIGVVLLILAFVGISASAFLDAFDRR